MLGGHYLAHVPLGVLPIAIAPPTLFPDLELTLSINRSLAFTSSVSRSAEYVMMIDRELEYDLDLTND